MRPAGPIVLSCFVISALVAACGSERPSAPLSAERSAILRAPPPPSTCFYRGVGDTIGASPCGSSIHEPANSTGLQLSFGFANDDAGGGTMTVECTAPLSSCTISPTNDLNGGTTATFNTGASGSGGIRVTDYDATYHLRAQAWYNVTVP